MIVLDPRHFDGTQAGSYDKWRFQLVADLAAIDPRFGDVAHDVARRTTPYLPTDLPPDEKVRRRAYLMLYSVIVGFTKNRPLRLVMETVSRDGREALRKLDAEHRTTYRGRQMALLRKSTHSHLHSASSDAANINNLSVRKYELKSGKELDKTYHAPEFELCWFRRRVHRQTVRVAAGGARVRADIWQGAGSDREDCNALREEALPQLQDHLRLRSEEIGTDYKKVILAIEG